MIVLSMFPRVLYISVDIILVIQQWRKNNCQSYNMFVHVDDTESYQANVIYQASAVLV